MKKNLFNSLYIGLKKGILTKTLPDHILLLQKNIYIRILRVLGGISIILLITHKLQFLGDGIIYIIAVYLCVFISLLFYAYILYINYHRAIHIYKLLKSDYFDIRNSP